MQNSSSFLDSIGRILESPRTGKLLNFVVIPILVLLILLLPPFSLLGRAQTLGYVPITADSGRVADPDGTSVIFPADGLTGKSYAKLDSVPREVFASGETSDDLRSAAENLPAELRMLSPVYQLHVRGDIPRHAIVTIPIPNDSLPYETIDLYNWNGKSWEWMPHTLLPEEDSIECDVNFAPNEFAVFQTVARPPIVGVTVPPGKSLPPQAADAATTIMPTALILRGDGGVDGVENLLSAESIDGQALMVVRNYKPGETPRTDLLANLLIDKEGMQVIQIDTLIEIATSKLYDGIVLDYRGADPPLRDDFSDFVRLLAERLHADGKRLFIYVDLPSQLSDDVWESFGYDWTALGVVADGIIVPEFENPFAYAPGGQAESLLNWAVGNVDRNKLLMQVSAQSKEQAGDYFIDRGFEDAMSPILGEVKVTSNVVEPGNPVVAQLGSDIVASPMQFDQATGISWYRYRGQSGEERIVFIENASSLAHKLTLFGKFNLGGVVTDALETGDYDPQLWDTLASYAAGEMPGQKVSKLSVDWKAFDSKGNVVAQVDTELGQPVQLDLPTAPDIYRIEAEIKADGAVISTQGDAQVAVATFTPTPTPTPVATPTPVPTPTPEAPAYAVAIATGDTNLRQGPGTNYARVGLLKKGEQLKIIGKNKDGSWWQLEGKDGKPVWIIASRVTTQGPTKQVAVAKNIPKPSKARPASYGGGGPRPAGASQFGYGVQVDPGNDPNFNIRYIKALGFNWVKVQMPWKYVEPSQGNLQWGQWDNLVNAYSGAGIKVLLSIPKAPDWARPLDDDKSVEGPPANPQTYANFVAAVAKRYAGKVQAIEVWNEQNLYYEAGGQGRVNVDSYMALLRAAYRAIKSVNPSMIVVSGALTPTGAPPPWAIDDRQYLRMMYDRGLKSVCDAVGAHPSGFANPPDAHWPEGDLPNKGYDDHPSFFFRNTMEDYHNIMVRYGDGNKTIWPTEFGWPVWRYQGDERFAFAQENSLEEQAQYTVRAYQMAKAWGFVGPMFLWNLDYAVTAPNTELANFGIIESNGQPTPAYYALQKMPK